MDMTWVTERVALGGGIWNTRNMEELAQAGVTHVLNMQIEFDDSPLAEPYGFHSTWIPYGSASGESSNSICMLRTWVTPACASFSMFRVFHIPPPTATPSLTLVISMLRSVRVPVPILNRRTIILILRHLSRHPAALEMVAQIKKGRDLRRALLRVSPFFDS